MWKLPNWRPYVEDMACQKSWMDENIIWKKLHPNYGWKIFHLDEIYILINYFLNQHNWPGVDPDWIDPLLSPQGFAQTAWTCQIKLSLTYTLPKPEFDRNGGQACMAYCKHYNHKWTTTPPPSSPLFLFFLFPPSSSPSSFPFVSISYNSSLHPPLLFFSFFFSFNML